MDSDHRRVIAQALKTKQWVLEGKDGQSHTVLLHLVTGKTVAAPSSSSDCNGIRNFVKEIEEISGVQLWNRSSRKPSRKPVATSGFRMYKTEFEHETGSRVDELVTAWHDNDRALQEIERKPHPSRRDICNARSHLGQLSEIGKQLKALHQPVPVREVSA
ncbi:hypothetical protein [Mycobacteroides abscessus]